jgi:hypothetical protein
LAEQTEAQAESVHIAESHSVVVPYMSDIYLLMVGIHKDLTEMKKSKVVEALVVVDDLVAEGGNNDFHQYIPGTRNLVDFHIENYLDFVASAVVAYGEDLMHLVAM